MPGLREMWFIDCSCKCFLEGSALECTDACTHAHTRHTENSSFLDMPLVCVTDHAPTSKLSQVVCGMCKDFLPY